MDGQDRHRPRRPTLLGKAALESLGGEPDPAQLAEAAHATASALVESGRADPDAETTARLVRLVDDHGLDTVATLWSERPARSLPGALWRLYALREWVRADPAEASADFAAGRLVAQVPRVVAGAAEPPTPEAVRSLADSILAGVFQGDLAVALERAGAFCRVVAAGRAHRADDVEEYDGLRASVLTRRSASLQRTAEDLEAAASLWRTHDLV
ncbi:MAG: hypothetical protein ACXV2H_09895 [Actinomycetes bacterium]